MMDVGNTVRHQNSLVKGLRCLRIESQFLNFVEKFFSAKITHLLKSL